MNLYLNLKIVDVLSIASALVTIIGSFYTLYVWNERRRQKQHNVIVEIEKIKNHMADIGVKKELAAEVEKKLDKITDLLT